MTDLPQPPPDNGDIERIRREIGRASPSKRRRAFKKFFLAALGSIPWVGGFLSAAADIAMGDQEAKADSLQSEWLEEHQEKIRRLYETLEAISARFEKLGDDIDERIQSTGYLDLVRRSFRAWDRADTDEKRRYVANLVTNAAGTKLTSDDVIRLFIDWLDTYHEAHFAVVQQIYQTPRISRYDIWEAIHGDFPREDSAEADLFRLLIHDLSVGRVIRQARETTLDGKFLRKPRTGRRGPASTTMESAFEDTKPYVLTELGEQFVHYTMTEIVPRLPGQEDNPEGEVNRSGR
jgi:hypothetical protein